MLSVSLQAELHALQERAAQEGRYVVDPAEAGGPRLPGQSFGARGWPVNSQAVEIR